MFYYSLSFSYRGATANNPDCSDEACEANNKAYREVIELMTSLGLTWRHAYSWPDGSLYLYVKTEKNDFMLNNALVIGLSQGNAKGELRHIYNVAIEEVDKGIDPYKAGCPTLESYFSLPLGPEAFLREISG